MPKDESFDRKISKNGEENKNKRSILSEAELLETKFSNKYFTFMTVQHPFDRLILVYHNEISKGCTDLSKIKVPKIMKMMRNIKDFSELFDHTTGCIKVLPTFQEFVYFINMYPNEQDYHWKSINMVRKLACNCSNTRRILFNFSSNFVPIYFLILKNHS